MKILFVVSIILSVNLVQAINYFLPGDVSPTYYNIRLTPNIEQGYFYGETSINITVSTNDTKSITLHAKNLKFEESVTTVIDVHNNQVKPVNQTIDNESEFLILHFPKTPLAAGEYVLKLQYAGQLGNNTKGFYRSSYTGDNNEKTWIAATHFTPTHARQAFPCFDQPAMKAKFQISIEHDYKYRAISNMPVRQVEDIKTSLKFRTTFKLTPIMSTYVVAFVIADLDATTSDERSFTVWSRRSQIQKTQYALTIGESALELLEDYTVFELAVPKLDNVAIPRLEGYFTSDWGLVTHGENEILYEKNVTTTKEKQDIAMHIVREFAHQWFGNLVSPSWWDDVWLNEGFANYFQYHITDEIETDWRMMDQFVIKNLQEKAFVADDNGIQRPLRASVSSPTEIANNFDDITSNKAGCIIRMFSHALGAKTFRTGMKAFLKNFAYANATVWDLRNTLANTKGVPPIFSSYYGTWITQKGYPLLKVTRHPNGNFKLEQSRYLPKKTAATSNEVWSIPLTWSYQGETNFEDTTTNMWFVASISAWYTGKPNKWIIMNKKQTGFYRVSYDDYNWNLIIKDLNTKEYVKIHPLNRAQLLDDSFHLAQSGYYSDHQKFLQISEHLQNEIDYVPWYPAYRAFSYINRALMSTEDYDLFKRYMLKLLVKMENSVGYTEKADDDHLTKLNRLKVVEWACRMGSVNCTTAAHQKLVQHLNGSRKISTDLRIVTLCAGIRTANKDLWDETFRYYKKSHDEKERRALLNALGCSPDKKILKSYLTKSMDPLSEVSLETTVKAIVDGSVVGVDATMDFIKRNFAKIIGNGGDEQTILRCMNYIGKRMFVESQMEKLERFINSLLAEHRNLSNALTANALASVLSNIEWIEKYKRAISSFLESQNLVD